MCPLPHSDGHDAPWLTDEVEALEKPQIPDISINGASLTQRHPLFCLMCHITSNPIAPFRLQAELEGVQSGLAAL